MNKPSFDGLAPWYFLLEKLSFGNQLQKCRLSQLEELKDATSVLILGDGNGRFLESFLKFNVKAKIDSLDISQKMINLAKLRVALIPNNTEVVFIHSDVFEWNFPENNYDLVVTNFFLDCFNFDELKTLINKISISLKPKGKLMYGDFNVPNSFFKKAITMPILGVMYLFFRITTGISTNKLIDPTLLLIENGFTLNYEKHQLGSFIKSQIWIKS